MQGHCEYLKENVSRRRAAPRRPGLRRAPVRGQAARSTTPTCPIRCCTCRARTFAHFAAAVYAANGIHVHILPPDSPRYLATPELSFTIRHLQAHGGLNISASHNPPDDNGGKFYDERGGQPVPPDDQIMADFVDQVSDDQVAALGRCRAHRARSISSMTSTHQAYIDLCRKQSLVPPPRVRRIQDRVHAAARRRRHDGDGGCCTAQGFRPIPVEEQMTPDGQFPNVTKSPNPEVPESLDRAERVAREHHADLVLATDPDADRLGGMSPDGARRLPRSSPATRSPRCSRISSSINLHEQGRMPRSPIVITTVVTTSLVTRIARHLRLPGRQQFARRLQVHGRRDVATGSQTAATRTCKATPADLSSPPRRAMASWRCRKSATRTRRAAALLFAELGARRKAPGADDCRSA